MGGSITKFAQAIAVLQISVVILQVALFVILLLILKLMREDLEQNKKNNTPFPSTFKYPMETVIKGGQQIEEQNKDINSISSDTSANDNCTPKTNTKVSQSFYS